MNRETQVQQLLASVTGKVAAPELETWRIQTQAVGQARLDQQRSDTALVKAAYVTTLKERREQAANRSDDVETQRYDGLLQAAGANNP
jgi:hypothetical protein